MKLPTTICLAYTKVGMRPVFIGGCDRSGTTLLGAMLGSHTDCLAVPEAQFIIDAVAKCSCADGIVNLQCATDEILGHWRFKLWSIAVNPNIVSKKRCETSYPQLIESIVKIYGIKHDRVTPKIWIDHTPWNLKYASRLFELFPQAKMIHIVRDGRAVASSIMPLDFGPNTIIRTTRWWLEKVAVCLAAESAFGKDKIIRIRYEDLLTDPENTLKKLCTHVNIDYQPTMVTAMGFKVPDYTSKQHDLVGRNLDRSRLKAWENLLTERQIQIFESITGDLLTYLGYDLKYGLKARGFNTVEMVTAGAQELLKAQIINRIRRLKRIRGYITS